MPTAKLHISWRQVALPGVSCDQCCCLVLLFSSWLASGPRLQVPPCSVPCRLSLLLVPLCLAEPLGWALCCLGG